MLLKIVLLALVTLSTSRFYSGDAGQSYYQGWIHDSTRFFDKFGVHVFSDNYNLSGDVRGSYAYMGTYVNGTRKGLGCFFAKQFQYCGQVNDLPEGKGYILKYDQSVLVSNWINGTANGNGTKQFIKNNTIFSGLFKGEQLVKGDKYTFKKPVTYLPIKKGGNKFVRQNTENEGIDIFTGVFCDMGACSKQFTIVQKGIKNNTYFGQVSQQLIPEGFGTSVNSEFTLISNWKNNTATFQSLYMGSNGKVKHRFSEEQSFQITIFEKIVGIRKKTDSMKEFKAQLARQQQIAISNSLQALFLLTMLSAATASIV